MVTLATTQIHGGYNRETNNTIKSTNYISTYHCIRNKHFKALLIFSSCIQGFFQLKVNELIKEENDKIHIRKLTCDGMYLCVY